METPANSNRDAHCNRDAEELQSVLVHFTNSQERMHEDALFQAITTMHPTLQQAFWREMKQVIYRYAELGDVADARNKASVEFCKRISESRAAFVALPFV